MNNLLSFQGDGGVDLFKWAIVQTKAKHLYRDGEITANERDLLQAGFMPATIHGESK